MTMRPTVLFAAVLLSAFFAAQASAASLTVCNTTNSEVGDIFLNPHPRGLGYDRTTVKPGACATIKDIPEGTYEVDIYTGFDCRTTLRIAGDTRYAFDPSAKAVCDKKTMDEAGWQ